jgi:CHASE3 domain sensor protein
VSALLLILVAGSAALSLRAYVLYGRASSTSSDVIRASNDVLIELLNAETGQRGFLLTGRPNYLQSYGRAVLAIPADQQRLGSQVSTVPEARQYLVTLNTLVSEKLAGIDTTIGLARAGQRARALQIVDSGEDQQIMGHVRRVIADLNRAATAIGALRRGYLRTQLIVFAVLAIFFGIAVVAVILFLRRLLSTAVQQVRKRTGHLERANSAMEAFTYSVAHDLRTRCGG